jgi:DNA polymerase III delta prime subunit
MSNEPANVCFNEILERTASATKLKQILADFNKNKCDLSVKRGIYIYGSPGCGKTEFVTRILNEQKYDVIRYDAGDIRNKTIIDTITKHSMSDQSVMSFFEQSSRKIVIVMDEIDGMNTGDKGGITSLIKLIRPKKTKKQKNEDYTLNPIICIGNYEMDKKIKEIMKVCHIIELKIPTASQMRSLVDAIMPDIENQIAERITTFVQSDIRKFMTIYNVYVKNKTIINNEVLDTVFRAKYYSENSRLIMTQLFNKPYTINDHATMINETDRTIIGLLWHENVIDKISTDASSTHFYETVLKNICFSDYIDRITFQNQIWIFNEMSSLVKTFYNNAIYHQFKNKNNAGGAAHHGSDDAPYNASDIRFTKVLTKYSTEYNNSLFIQHLCNQLLMDQKDLVGFFKDLRDRHSDEANNAIFEQYEITKLDVERIYRFIDKFSTTATSSTDTNIKKVSSVKKKYTKRDYDCDCDSDTENIICGAGHYISGGIGAINDINSEMNDD